MYEVPDAIAKHPRFQALASEVHSAAWAVAVGCQTQRIDGSIFGAEPEYMENRARLHRLTRPRLWWCLTVLALEGFLTAEEVAGYGGRDDAKFIRLGLPGEPLDRVASKVAREHGPTVAQRVELVVRQACEAMRLGDEPFVHHAYLMGVLGAFDDANDVGPLEMLRRMGF